MSEYLVDINHEMNGHDSIPHLSFQQEYSPKSFYEILVRSYFPSKYSFAAVIHFPS